jgi:hypothetical protein
VWLRDISKVRFFPENDSFGGEEHTDITSFLQVLTQVVTPGAAMLVNVDNVLF